MLCAGGSSIHVMKSRMVFALTESGSPFRMSSQVNDEMG